MRVIAGKYKRRQLKAVPGQNTRPTTDKNKENLFNMISPYLEGGIVLDLFAGSGALGIEAMSRGMDELYSVDVNYKAYKIVKENIESLGVENAHVYKMSCFQALTRFKEENIKFSLVLLDPPYDQGFSEKVVHILVENDMLSEKSIVVVEEKNNVILKENYGLLKLRKQVNYGLTTLHIYKMEESE